MSQSATPARQDDMTTCLETFEKERFCSFPNRHGINDPTTTRRRPDETLEANKGPGPQTINGNPSLRIREFKNDQKNCTPWKFHGPESLSYRRGLERFLTFLDFRPRMRAVGFSVCSLFSWIFGTCILLRRLCTRTRICPHTSMRLACVIFLTGLTGHRHLPSSLSLFLAICLSILRVVHYLLKLELRIAAKCHAQTVPVHACSDMYTCYRRNDGLFGPCPPILMESKADIVAITSDFEGTSQEYLVGCYRAYNQARVWVQQVGCGAMVMAVMGLAWSIVFGAYL